MRKLAALMAAMALFAFGPTPAWALDESDTSTDTEGATTITWDSSFQDPFYVKNTTVIMVVDWTVDAGAANYVGGTLKKVTPKSRRDPAEVDTFAFDYPGDNGIESVNIEVTFDKLHCDKKRGVDIGNAHFKLILMVDEDGDGTPDEVEDYGVNLHVEQQGCTSD